MPVLQERAWKILRGLGQWAWPTPVLRLQAGTRAAFIGRPGSGKTILQRWLLERVPSVVVYDTKLDPHEWAVAPGYTTALKPATALSIPRVVLQVPIEWLRDTNGWRKEGTPGWNWTLCLDVPMQRRNTVAVFDEALLTLPHTSGHDLAHRLFQQGRSFRVSVFVGSQLANNLDTRVLRTAEHIICFRTIHETDLKELESARGVRSWPLKVLRPWEFAYHHESDHTWTVFRPISPHRPLRLRQRAYVPTPEIAEAPWRERFADRREAWLQRHKQLILAPFAIFTLVAERLLGISVGVLIPIAVLALVTYQEVRLRRSLRWRVVVECTDSSSPSLLSLPAAEAAEPAAEAEKVEGLPEVEDAPVLNFPGRRGR